MKLPPGDGPLYQRLADKLSDDIRTGVIPTGTRLATQRDLAMQLGTTVGTVGRAYTLLQERGLANGEVGRGTYVQTPPAISVAPSPGKAELLARIAGLEAQIAELRATVERF